MLKDWSFVHPIRRGCAKWKDTRSTAVEVEKNRLHCNEGRKEPEESTFDRETPLSLVSVYLSCGVPDSWFSTATIAEVMTMGFSRDQAIKALRAAGGDVQRAINWLLEQSAS